MKTILKVLYVALMAIFAVLVYLATYNNAGYSIYSGYINEAIEQEKYEQVGKALALFGIPYDPVYQVYKEDGTTSTTVIFNEMYNLKVEYQEEGKTNKTKYSQVEDSYFICVFHPDYDISNVDGEELTNQTAVRFYSGDKYYDYLMIRSEEINVASYKKEPVTFAETILNDVRTCTTTYSPYEMYFLNITESVMKEITTTLGGTVDSYNLINNEGKAVYKEKVTATLDYSQKYFSDNNHWERMYNITLDKENGIGDWTDEEKSEASEYISTFDLSTIGDGAYDCGYLQKDIYTASCIWQSVGYTVLFAVCVALIYILLFEFKRIRNIIERITTRGQSTNRQAPRVPRPVNTPTTIQRQREQKPAAIEAKTPEAPEVKEEPKEAVEPITTKTEENLEAIATETPVIDAEVVEPEAEVKEAE